MTIFRGAIPGSLLRKPLLAMRSGEVIDLYVQAPPPHLHEVGHTAQIHLR